MCVQFVEMGAQFVGVCVQLGEEGAQLVEVGVQFVEVCVLLVEGVSTLSCLGYGQFVDVSAFSCPKYGSLSIVVPSLLNWVPSLLKCPL